MPTANGDTVLNIMMIEVFSASEFENYSHIISPEPQGKQCL